MGDLPLTTAGVMLFSESSDSVACSSASTSSPSGNAKCTVQNRRNSFNDF